MSLSPAQKLRLIQGALNRGSICHWQQPFGPHFAVILNNVWPPPDDVVLFSIMTSKTLKFPAIVDNEIIRTGPEEYSFLNVPTVIDLRVVHAVKLPSTRKSSRRRARSCRNTSRLRMRFSAGRSRLKR